MFVCIFEGQSVGSQELNTCYVDSANDFILYYVY